MVNFDIKSTNRIGPGAHAGIHDHFTSEKVSKTCKKPIMNCVIGESLPLDMLLGNRVHSSCSIWSNKNKALRESARTRMLEFSSFLVQIDQGADKCLRNRDKINYEGEIKKAPSTVHSLNLTKRRKGATAFTMKCLQEYIVDFLARIETCMKQSDESMNTLSIRLEKLSSTITFTKSQFEQTRKFKQSSDESEQEIVDLPVEDVNINEKLSERVRALVQQNALLQIELQEKEDQDIQSTALLEMTLERTRKELNMLRSEHARCVRTRSHLDTQLNGAERQLVKTERQRSEQARAIHELIRRQNEQATSSEKQIRSLAVQLNLANLTIDELRSRVALEQHVKALTPWWRSFSSLTQGEAIQTVKEVFEFNNEDNKWIPKTSLQQTKDEGASIKLNRLYKRASSSVDGIVPFMKQEKKAHRRKHSQRLGRFDF